MRDACRTSGSAGDLVPIAAMRGAEMEHAVAIIGADGHVGRHLAALAEGDGLETRRVGRNDDLAAALAGAAAAIHLQGTLQATGGNSYQAANVGTLARTVDAARKHGVARVVFLSYVGADAGARNAYLRTKGAAEALLRDSGLEAVIVRSTFIFGPPEDPGPSFLPFLQEDGKPVAVVGEGRQRYQPVYVGDVGLAAAGGRVAPGTYSIAGPEALTLDELVALVNGHEVTERHLHGLAARAAAAVSPRLTQAMVGVLSGDSLPDVPVLWPHVGFAPTALREIYRGVEVGV
jgi:uncharacterized protein YbjT (DUF2867 family)